MKTWQGLQVLQVGREAEQVRASASSAGIDFERAVVPAAQLLDARPA